MNSFVAAKHGFSRITLPKFTSGLRWVVLNRRITWTFHILGAVVILKYIHLWSERWIRSATCAPADDLPSWVPIGVYNNHDLLFFYRISSSVPHLKTHRLWGPKLELLSFELVYFACIFRLRECPERLKLSTSSFVLLQSLSDWATTSL